MKYFLLSCLIAIISLQSITAQQQHTQVKAENRTNAKNQQEKPYVILISADGFKYDYFKKYQPKFLSQQKEKGVFGKMIPSYPSVTFPNHYTIVTGLTPPHHGVIGNNMYDPNTKGEYSLGNQKAVTDSTWYGGTPIWSLAESQELLTACFYWPGSEAKIANYRPSYYYPYAENIGVKERINNVVDWLNLPEEKRPHLITFYMPQVDQAGHRFGTDALETESAINYVDKAIQKLTQAVEKTGVPVNFIFLSDHGMVNLDTEHPLILPEYDKNLVNVVNNGTYVSIFVKDSNKIDEVFKHFEKEASPQKYAAYLTKDVPKKYKFSDQHDRYNREGDIVLIAESPYYFAKTPDGNIPKASHGFFPKDTPDMNTVFLSWGPDIQSGKTIKAFQNTHVFPLLTDLLQLKQQHAVDGDKRLVPKVLKDK